MGNQSITVLLDAVRRGEMQATNELFATVYEELKRVARSNRRRWRGNQTLNTTVLIHEVYLKLSGREKLNVQNRAHFYATASQAMRQILINYAERANAAKRGGDAVALPLDDDSAISDSMAEELLVLTENLELLERDDPRRCRVVECRVLGGMSVEETAAALDISPATVKRDWQVASTILHRDMEKTDGSDASNEG